MRTFPGKGALALGLALSFTTLTGCTGFGIKDRAYVFDSATDAHAAASPAGPRTVALTPGAAPNASRTDSLTAMTFNMKHKNRPRELASIARDLRQNLPALPDFLLCQEVVFGSEGPDDHTAELLAKELGCYSKGTKRTSDSEGVGIISKYPFAYYAERHLDAQTSRLLLGFRRVSVMGEFNVPGVGLVRVVNTHLTNWGFEGHVRRKQIAETLAWIDEREKAVPAALTLLGGDFNADRSRSEMNWLQLEGKTPGDPVVFRDFNSHTPTFSAAGRNRIDYLFIASPARDVKLTEERVLWKDGVRHPDGDRFDPSDHLAVYHRYALTPKPNLASTLDAADLAN